MKGSQVNRDNIGLQVYQHRTAMSIARESPERKSGEHPPRENTHMCSHLTLYRARIDINTWKVVGVIFKKK